MPALPPSIQQALSIHKIVVYIFDCALSAASIVHVVPTFCGPMAIKFDCREKLICHSPINRRAERRAN